MPVTVGMSATPKPMSHTAMIHGAIADHLNDGNVGVNFLAGETASTAAGATSGVTVTLRDSIIDDPEPETTVLLDHVTALEDVDDAELRLDATRAAVRRLTPIGAIAGVTTTGSRDATRGASASTAFDDAPLTAIGTVTGSNARRDSENAQDATGIVQRGPTSAHRGRD